MGAEPKMTERENRLQLADVDWTMLERWIAEGAARRRTPGSRSTTATCPRRCGTTTRPQFSPLLNTIPFDDLDHGEIVVTPAVMADWYERLELAGETQYTVLTREPDGPSRRSPT